MASAASRCRYRSRLSKAVHRPSGPWTRLATTRWVCSSVSPARDVRWSRPTANSPCPAGHVLHTPVAAAGTNLLVQVGDRLPDAGVVGLEDGSAGRRITEPVEDRDALGRAQDHVEGWHGPLAVEAAEQLAGVG